MDASLTARSGGSIARREDLVKTKAKAVKADKKASVYVAWRTCALSKQPLAPPVVADALGRLYNKDSLLEHLLRPGVFGADGALTAAHIRSLKDVVPLKLEERPEGERQTTEDDEPVRFICPLTRRDMDGTVPFVYVRPCGCVLSLSGLRNAGKDAPSHCPVCAVPLEAVVTLNPVGDEAKRMKDAWEAVVAADRETKRAKKAAKRKSGAVAAAGGGEAKTDEPESKKARVAPLEPAKPTAPRLPAAIQAATQAAADKASKSSTLASLYAKPAKLEEGRSDWMTRGTFSRYA